MRPKNTLIWGVLLGLTAGIVAGAGAYELGIEYSCPKSICVDSARITPVTDRGYYDAAHKIISGAEESVHIVAFEIKYYRQQPGSRQNAIIEDLIEAKKRGVDVKVLVDEYSTNNNAHSKLRQNGIPVIVDDNKTTTHAKLIIVDGKATLLGSTNLSYFALEKNNEANILIEDRKTAQHFERYFQQLWENAQKRI